MASSKLDEEKVFKVKVTQLKISHPFVKLFVQNASNKHFSSLQQLKNLYREATADEILLGGIYIAKIASGQYERVRVVQVSDVEETATVSFLDCGYIGILPLNQLRVLKESKLLHMKPLCKEFVLARIRISSYDVKEKFLPLHDLIINKKCEMAIVGENEAGKLVDLRLRDASLVHDIIPNDQFLSAILKPMDLEEQKSTMIKKKKEKDQKMKEKAFRPETLIESPESKHKENPMKKVDYPVKITSYEDESLSFFVRFTSSETEFEQFQSNLQRQKENLVLLKRNPSIGTKCIAHIDRQLHRATVIKASEKFPNSEVIVRLMETGSKMTINISKLFMMPDAVAEEPPFANQYKLADFEESKFEDLQSHEINFYFRHITREKVLMLNIQSKSGSIPTCHLFDDGVNVLDKIRDWNPQDLKFAPRKPLRGNHHQVTVCSAVSPKLFFVQLLHNSESSQYKNLMESLKVFEPPKLRNPKVGDVCMVRYENLNLRGQIIGKSTSEYLKILLVDIGFEEEFHLNEIRMMVEEFMNFPPFAIQCCLEGLENLEEVKSTTSREFESICKRFKEMKLRIVKWNCDSYIVELKDSTGESIIDQLRDLKFNNSEWTEAPSSFSSHIRNRVQNDDSIWSLTESPKKHEKSEYWDSSSSGQKSLSENEEDSGSSTNDATVKPKKSIEAVNLKNSDEIDDWDLSKQFPKEGSSSNSSTSGVSTMVELCKREAVRITAVAQPTDLTVQKSSAVEDYENYLKQLQPIAKSQHILAEFSIGLVCLAYHPFDKAWCRAIILDFDKLDFCVTVKCLDNGTTFSIQDKRKLKSPSANLSREPYFGIQCSLPIKFNPKKEVETTKYLMSLRNENLSYQLITVHEKISYIELYVGDLNVTDSLVELGLAKRLFIMAPGPAYIVNVNSMSDFSIQMESDSNALKEIVNYTENYSHCLVKNPKIGMMVLGHYKANNGWYRAKIVAKEKNLFKVYFIDHGHEESVEKIGAIEDPAIAEIHPLGIKCSLVLPKGSQTFNKDSEKKFNELFGNGDKKIIVRLINPGEKFALVDFQEDENSESISERLMPIDGLSKQVMSLDNFEILSDSDDGF